MICCGAAWRRMGILGVSVRKIKALTLKMKTVTLIDKGRKNLTYFVYSVYEINSKIYFLSGHIVFGGVCLIFV